MTGISSDKRHNASKFLSIQDIAMDRYSVRLTSWHARMARRLGNGTLSDGIREAIERQIKALNDESKRFRLDKDE